jgi:hypothetical protein
LLQATPEHLRGRTLSLATSGLMLANGLSFAAAGAAAEFARPQAVIVASGLAGLLVVTLLARPITANLRQEDDLRSPSPSPARGLPGTEAVQAHGTARPGRGLAFSAAEEPREGAELTPGAAGQDGDRERDGQGSPDQQVAGVGPPGQHRLHTPPPVR